MVLNVGRLRADERTVPHELDQLGGRIRREVESAVARRPRVVVAVLAVVALAATGCTQELDEVVAPEAASAGAACVDRVGIDRDLASAITDVAETARDELGLRTVLVSVTRDGEELVTAALGDSIDGVPATTEMRFPNGAAVFASLGVAMVQLDAEGALDLDEPIERWVDGVPGGDRITPRMLMSSTSGLDDYVPLEAWVDDLYDDPFRPFSTEELEAYVFPLPLMFEPGTNVGYTHLGFRLAGAVVEAAAGRPVGEVLRERVSEPLGLVDTEVVATAEVPGPRLRTFTDERGPYEDSTAWSAAWGVPDGAVQVTTVCDLARSAAGIGAGELLDEADLATYLDPGTVGLGDPSEDCPRCIPMTEQLHFGMGVTVAGDWVMQTPLFTGIAATMAYLPGDDLAIGVAATFGPDGDVGENAATAITVRLGELLAPRAPFPPQVG